MILADVFCSSQVARDCEFQTTPLDSPLVVQFASSNSTDFAQAARLVAPYASAVDLNCGCPQRWAAKQRLGGYLMSADPQLIHSMVRETRNLASLPVSVKIRIHKDNPEKTIELVKQIESAGASWVTIHARDIKQRSTECPDWNTFHMIKQSVQIPLVANGSILSMDEAERVAKITGCNGIMAARGLLANPAMFNGNDITPIETIYEFVRNSLKYGSSSFVFQQHLSFMLEKRLDPSQRKLFHTLCGTPAILDFLNENIFQVL